MSGIKKTEAEILAARDAMQRSASVLSGAGDRNVALPQMAVEVLNWVLGDDNNLFTEAVEADLIAWEKYHASRNARNN